MRVLTSETKLEPIDAVKPHPRNPRQGDIGAIHQSIQANGFYGAIIAQKSTGHIIAGNHRWMAARQAKAKKIPVTWLDIDDDHALRILLADNRTNDLASYADEMLAEILQELHATTGTLDGTGYDGDDLDEILTDLQPKIEIEQHEIPEPPIAPVTKPGDLWILGKHRLLCGDSTNPKDVSKLMNGQKADLCFTSPPYGLGKSIELSGNKKMSAKKNAYDNHHDNPETWFQLMNKWWEQSIPSVTTAWIVNVQPLAGNKRALMQWIHERSNRLVDIITWDKGHGVPQIAPGVLSSRYEWLIGFAAEGASRAFPLSTWQGTIESVYQAPPQRNNEYPEVHAATMPMHLPIWVLSELCNKTKTVYEPFSGTGTTLIAAEKLGRTCYAMEIDPTYCDITIKRWETATGKKAQLQPKNDTV